MDDWLVEVLAKLSFSSMEILMAEATSEKGKVLLNEFILPLCLTPEELAEDLGWPMKKMENVLDGSEEITELIAIEFSKYFGNSIDFWLNLESSNPS